MFWVRLMFRWFNNLSHVLESPCSSTLAVNWKYLLSKAPSIIACDDQSFSPSLPGLTTWNGLPDVAIKKIFEKLTVEDRTRLKLVSKSWNEILNRVDIPTALEAPWRILSDDSYSEPQIVLTEIRIQGDERDYHFKVPNFYDQEVPPGGCFCGTSNGWLAIATSRGPNLTPDLFLWNPLSGTIQKLPPLSTLPFATPKLDELPGVIKRVEIFSQKEYNCVVAMVFSLPTEDEDDEDTKDYLALCTPHEKRWSILAKGNSCRYSDILHYNGKLYALAKVTDDDDDDNDDDDDEEEEEEEEKTIKTDHTVCLSSRSNYAEVKVCVLLLKYKLSAQSWTRYDEEKKLISRSFNITYANEFCEHLVECSITGNLMVVAAIFDLYTYNTDNDGPVESFWSHQTRLFEVRMVETLERVTTIGEQCFYIGSKGSLSTMVSSTEGLSPDNIFFATDDAQGFFGEQDQCLVTREIGVFKMQQGDVFITGHTYLRFPVQSKISWFKPKL